MICKICNREFSSNKCLALHITKFHNISGKTYYDTYYRQPNEGNCLTCNKETSFINITKGYRLFCSKTCCNKSEYHQSHMKNTIISRWGGMGTASKIINDKIKQTNINKYGTENVYASDYCKSKIQQTSQIKYGTQWPNQSKIVKNKIVQTAIDRYGTTNPGNGREARLKASKTMKLHGNKSSWEDYFESQCKKLNIRYESNYNLDPRYPFFVDFYLPDTDTFIEINGYWSHGKHWFDENNINDIIKVNKWKEKAKQGHKQYKNAIEVWTIRDKEKHECAIKNNLNYIVIWTHDELINFFFRDMDIKV